MTLNSKNIMLVSGSGRNVGKTSFIRRVIRQNASRKLVAIKITPHFHEPSAGLIPLVITENYRIFKEEDLTSGKDSSLFLQAGAEKVFYIQSTDEYLESAFSIITDYISSDQPIIVESAALRKFIVPELYLFIQKNYEEVKPAALEIQKLADIILYSDSGQFSKDPARFIFDQTWKIIQDDNS
jgi:hypothetical protein